MSLPATACALAMSAFALPPGAGQHAGLALAMMTGGTPLCLETGAGTLSSSWRSRTEGFDGSVRLELDKQELAEGFDDKALLKRDEKPR